MAQTSLLTITTVAVVAALYFTAFTVSAAVVPQEHHCTLNEQFTTCGTMCPERCPIRNERTGEIDTGAGRACIAMCRVGCVCAPGMVRDLKRNSACVLRAECSAP